MWCGVVWCGVVAGISAAKKDCERAVKALSSVRERDRERLRQRETESRERDRDRDRDRQREPDEEALKHLRDLVESEYGRRKGEFEQSGHVQGCVSHATTDAMRYMMLSALASSFKASPRALIT